MEGGEEEQTYKLQVVVAVWVDLVRARVDGRLGRVAARLTRMMPQEGAGTGVAHLHGEE
jgi:hypothetical protein